MPSLEWILVLALVCLTALFLVLWVRARRVSSVSGDLPAGVENTLLAVGQLEISGARHQFGVVSPQGGRAIPFLTDQNLGHLKVGDAFTMRNGQAYKVETRKSTPASGDSPTEVEPAAVALTAAPARTEVADTEIDSDAAQRTVLYLEDNQSAISNLEHVFPFLDVVAGPDAGMRFPLPYGEAGIGRGDDNVVTLSDDGASRQHCSLEFTGTEFVLRDLDSTNGTFRNGEEIGGKCSLEFGDRIEVSDSELVFSCEGFEQRDQNPQAAILAFELCVGEEPDFLQALKNLAFLLERDISRKKEAEPIWSRISRLEKGR